jgi:hypothetical protein
MNCFGPKVQTAQSIKEICMKQVGTETDTSQYDDRQATEVRTFCEVSRPALGHTPPFQWGVKLTTHPHLGYE